MKYLLKITLLLCLLWGAIFFLQPRPIGRNLGGNQPIVSSLHDIVKDIVHPGHFVNWGS